MWIKATSIRRHILTFSITFVNLIITVLSLSNVILQCNIVNRYTITSFKPSVLLRFVFRYSLLPEMALEHNLSYKSVLIFFYTCFRVRRKFNVTFVLNFDCITSRIRLDFYNSCFVEVCTNDIYLVYSVPTFALRLVLKMVQHIKKRTKSSLVQMWCLDVNVYEQNTKR